MKKLRYLLLLLALLVITTIPVSATGGGSGDDEDGDVGGDEVINPPSYRRTGYVFYIIDESGSRITEPEAVFWDSTEGINSAYNYITPRYGGGTVVPDGHLSDITPNWDKPPFYGTRATTNGVVQGYGGYIKNWLLEQTAPGDYNCLRFIGAVWGDGQAQAFIENDNHILVVEDFMWTSIYSGSTYITNIAGTVTGWAKARQIFDGLIGTAPSWNSNSTYPFGNLCNSMFYDIPVAGVPAPTKTIGIHSADEMLANGYGCVAVWSSEVTGEMPEKEVAPVASDANSLRSDELNMIYGDFAGLRKGGIPYPSYADLNIVKIDMKKAVKSSEASKPSLVPGSYKYDPTYKVEVSHAGSVWGHNGNELFYFYSGSPKLDRAKWKVSWEDKVFSTDNDVYEFVYFCLLFIL